MVVPILIAAYLAGYFFSGRPVAVILIILFGLGVSFRNTYKIIMHEIAQKSDSKENIVGRPEGYEDEDEDGEERERRGRK